MKLLWKNYKSSIILLISILIGGLLGAILGTKAVVLKPFGDLFLNLMFTIIVPLVFFSVTSAIGNMTGMKRLGKIISNIFLVFFITAIIAAIIGYIGTLIWNPTIGVEVSAIKKLMVGADEVSKETQNLTLLGHLVKTFTVTDFMQLFSKSNMLQLIVFSVIFGVSIALVGEKAKPMANFVSAGASVMMKMVSIIMYYAPIGLGCYFASVIGELGPQILEGYLRAFILYLGLSVIYYFGFFTLYAFLAGGKDGVKIFWRNVIAPSVTAIATCSSAACIPINLQASKNMGVPVDIAETTIPLGANTHKDGSVFGGVLKITFLFGIFGKDITSISSFLGIIAISFLVGAVMGAIPGGGMIGELLIISVYGFPPEVLPIIAVISTIIDAPATLLNSTGNTVCSMLVARLVEGENWLNNIRNKNEDKIVV